MKALLLLDSGDIYFNMALDEALLHYAVRNNQPIIRIYSWDKPSITIGYFQSVKDVLNESFLISNNIEFTRRITGGGSVIHFKELTYSIIMPTNLNVRDSYKLICSSIIDSLKSLGITAKYEPINDITINGLKVSGSAQTRMMNYLLQHGTLLLDIDRELMINALNIPKEKLEKYGEKLVIGLNEVSNISLQELRNALIEGFSRNLNMEIVQSTIPRQVSIGLNALISKYKSRGWKYLR